MRGKDFEILKRLDSKKNGEFRCTPTDYRNVDL